MGKALGKLWLSKNVTVLIIGPEGTGKTSVLHNLNLGNVKDRFIDQYQRLEALSGEHVQAVTWNMLGTRCPGGISGYYQKIDAVIYVVNDRGPSDHMALAKLGFYYFETIGCTKAAMAVLVNRRDTEEGIPLTLEEVRQGLDLDNMVSNTYELFPVVATTGEGLDSVQDWLSCQLGKKFARQTFFGSDAQQSKKQDSSSLHTRMLRSFKELFSRI
ncbi:ADP-ribosylation factor-like protein 1 [Argopecten irradians]|uniref:ADP-ribosylation factor-like protein 1 n=1 Tax=Argopecten irradians TaxID=31199 RepID=UPI00371EA958